MKFTQMKVLQTDVIHFFFVRKFFFSLRRMNQTVCAKKHQAKKHQVSHPFLKTSVKMSFTKEL